MRYILIFFFLSTLTLSLTAQPFQIIPQPQQTELLQGEGLTFGNLTNLKIAGDFKRPVMGCILTQLTESYTPGHGTLTLKLDSTGIAPESREGYILTISNGHAKIISGGEAGLFYGCQTLEQLLEDSRDFLTPVPACKITDSPALSYRAVHFDVKHHLDHMKTYYESIERLARYKINAVIFEFEDKLRYRRQPVVAAPQSISIDEMAALTQFARERHIEITPLVQGLGHATFILKHEQFAHLREFPDDNWVFCPMDEGTYEVLFDLYRDAIEATPGSRYLHIGGDEIGNIGYCPRCKPTADREGKLSLNLYWLKRVCEFADQNGRTPIFWDDMPLKEAGVYESTYDSDIDAEQAATIWEKGKPLLDQVISDFPKRCVYMRWNYSMAQQPGNLFALDWYREHGLKAMIATAAQSGPAALFPFDERSEGMSSRGIMAIKSFVQLAADKGIDGMLCTAWDDRSPHMETVWRGLIAAAEYSWSPHGRTLDAYDDAYLQREYGTSVPGYATLYNLLREASIFWESAFNRDGSRMDSDNALLNLSAMVHWLPPEQQEKREKTDFTDLLIELPDLQKPGFWSAKYEQRLHDASMVIEQYQSTSATLDSLYNGSERNRYHWEVFSALNDFQIAAPRLLLALQQCDTADKTRQLTGTRRVLQALSEFDNAWENLQTVYNKTRFITYPPDYVPDRHHHYASQREDLSWMIQVEELFHQMVNRWLDSNQLIN